MSTSVVGKDLSDIAGRVDRGDRLSHEDGVRLFASDDVHTIGELADVVRRRLHDRKTYYNVNLHINYSNYCVLRCKFCSFYRPYDKKSKKEANGRASETKGLEAGSHLAILTEGAADTPIEGYELSIEEIVARARGAYGQGATEVHIVGGLHPTLPFDFYLDMCRSIRQACPEMHIKAFTAIEIIHFTRITKPRLSIGEVLEQLQGAGLGSLPGGGAEIFDDRVHEEAYKNKVGEAGWFDVHRAAHEMGMYTNATMLYGHVETVEQRVGHMIKLREHQDASLAERKAAFNCLIPLSFIPDGSELGDLPGPTGLTDLKTLAISRLMCDNIPHIKSFWIMHSPKLSQVSLHWGVDDLDGTVGYYDITKREGGGGTTHQELTVDQMRRLITRAGFSPVERDTLYRPVVRDNGQWRVESDGTGE